ncbi:MAG TPA: cold shock domain-containing protein [Candidatus Eisenbacteria bacterium]|jgi:CspA family cold shock protein
MARGTVKWFNDQKGYGFITSEGREEVFVHHASIQGQGFRTLHEGEQVEFEIKTGERGAEAAHVTRIA